MADGWRGTLEEEQSGLCLTRSIQPVYRSQTPAWFGRTKATGNFNHSQPKGDRTFGVVGRMAARLPQLAQRLPKRSGLWPAWGYPQVPKHPFSSSPECSTHGKEGVEGVPEANVNAGGVPEGWSPSRTFDLIQHLSRRIQVPLRMNGFRQQSKLLSG